MNPSPLTCKARHRRDWTKVSVHILLIVAVVVIGFPLYYCFVISTQNIDEVIQKPQKMLPSTHLVENYTKVWNRTHMGRLLINSAIVAVTVSLGKILISILSAFAIVYFNFRGKQIAFWMIFVTLMLPVPVRIISTYQVVSTLGWVDTYAGLTIPLIASATATFLFRQFYMTIPDELVDAAKIDGSGPLRFLWSILSAQLRSKHRCTLCRHVHLRLEPVPLASDGNELRKDESGGGRHRLHDPHGNPTPGMEPCHGSGHNGHSSARFNRSFHAALVCPWFDRE